MAATTQLPRTSSYSPALAGGYGQPVPTLLTARPLTVDGLRYTGENLADLQAAFGGRRRGTGADAAPVRAHPHGPYPVTYRDPTVSAEVWHADLGVWQPLSPGDWVLRHHDGLLTVARHDRVTAAYDASE